MNTLTPEAEQAARDKVMGEWLKRKHARCNIVGKRQHVREALIAEAFHLWSMVRSYLQLPNTWADYTTILKARMEMGKQTHGTDWMVNDNLMEACAELEDAGNYVILDDLKERWQSGALCETPFRGASKKGGSHE